MTTGILTAFETCTDPSREEEFNRWYSFVHIPDLSAAHGFRGARRYMTGSTPPTRVYLAVYEFDSDDLERSVDELLELSYRSYRLGRHFEAIKPVTEALPKPAIWSEIRTDDLEPLVSVDYPTSSAALDEFVFTRIRARLGLT